MSPSACYVLNYSFTILEMFAVTCTVHVLLTSCFLILCLTFTLSHFIFARTTSFDRQSTFVMQQMLLFQV